MFPLPGGLVVFTHQGLAGLLPSPTSCCQDPLWGPVIPLLVSRRLITKVGDGAKGPILQPRKLRLRGTVGAHCPPTLPPLIHSRPLCFGNTSQPSVKVKVAQSCPTLCDPMDCSPAGSSICGILWARIPEWVAVPFSRGSSQPGDRTQVSRIAGGFFSATEGTLVAEKASATLSGPGLLSFHGAHRVSIQFGIRQTWVRMLSPLRTSWVTSGRLLSLTCKQD